MRAWYPALAGLLVLCGGCPGAAAEAEVLWTVDVPPDPGASGTTFWIPDAALLEDGRAVLLGLEGQKASLMISPSPGELGDWIDLPMQGSLTVLEVDPELGIWIGGYSRSGDVNGALYRDVAIVHLDLAGNILWASGFGDQSELFALEDIEPMPSGDIVVSGRFFQAETFVMRISAAGELLWRNTVGIGKGSELAVLPDGNVMVIAFASAEDSLPGAPYAEDAVTWIFSPEGQELSHSVVRRGINRDESARSGELSLAVSDEAIFATTEWTWPEASPVELARLSPAAEVLTETTVRKPRTDSGGPWCNPDIRIADTGVFVACGNEGLIDIYSVGADGGTLTALSADLPECNGRTSAKLVAVPEDDGSFLVLGRRPGFNIHGGCAFLARVTEE